MSEIITENLSYLINNAPTTEYLTKLTEFIDILKFQQIKIEKTKQISNDIKDKIKTTFNFINFIKTICVSTSINPINPCIFGSFPRMIFERFFTGAYEFDGYGNTINHDINIYLYEEKYDFNNTDFNTLINVMNLTKEHLLFGDYKIHSIHDKNTNRIKNCITEIPHYIIILQNKGKFIKYDLIGYKIKSVNANTDDFDVNSLIIDSNGIYSEQNFYNILNNIMNKSADCSINFNTLITPLASSGLRTSKVKILNEIIYFTCMRTKILSVGYSQIFNENSGNISISIERVHDCIITTLKPPYIQIELECGHKCSLMALSGIINVRASFDTESILCPFCRHILIPKLIQNKNTNKLQTYETGDQTKLLPNINPYEIGNELITKENKNYVNGLLFSLTPQQITERQMSDLDFINY